jgi:hypothetical protein
VPIVVALDEVLHDRRMTLANLSIPKTGKARAARAQRERPRSRANGAQADDTQARRRETRVQIPAPQSNEPPTALKPRCAAGEASSRRARAAETA